MSPLRASSAAATIAALALLHCSSNDTVIAADAACAHVALACATCPKQCSWLVRTSLASGADDYRAACTTSLVAPGTGYTAAWMDACARAIDATDCLDASDVPLACRAPYGRLADGQPCGGDDQCESGSFCDRGELQNDFSPVAHACGVCRTRTAVGLSCVSAAQCAVGSGCIAGVCRMVLRSSEGGPCSDTPVITCTGGLVCGNGGVCTRPRQQGEACGPNLLCARDLSCVAGKCETLGGAEGQRCLDTFDPCVAPLFCEPTTKICKEPAKAAPGEGCNGYDTVCAYGKCYFDAPFGGPFSGKCPDALGVGAVCSLADTTRFCMPPAACLDNVCTVRDPSACK